jgi:DNA-binding transcriptional LysR family regulator
MSFTRSPPGSGALLECDSVMSFQKFGVDLNFATPCSGNGTMDLVGLAAFNIVAAQGGLGRASRTSKRPKATLSRQIYALEESLGIRLLDRGSRSLRLTDEGRALYERTAGLLTEIEEVGKAICAGFEQVRGSLRISTPVLFAHMAMGQIAAEFKQAHPDIELEITAEDRFVDLVEEGYDVVIRGNPKAGDDLVGRCFLSDDMLIVAPPGFVSVPTKPGLACEIILPAAVLSTAHPGEKWETDDERGALAITPVPVIRLTSHVMIYDALRAGIGGAMLPRSMVARDLAEGNLVCLGVAKGRETKMWVLHPSRRLVSNRVAAFVRFLCDRYPERSISLDRDWGARPAKGSDLSSANMSHNGRSTLSTPT